MAGILIYSEKDSLALELISAANIMNPSGQIKALTVNNDPQAQVLAQAGAEVYQVNHKELVLADTAAMAKAIKQAVDKLDVHMVLLSSNRRGKELAGRLAQLMGAGCLTDITAVKVEGDTIECQRNALGGATIASQYIATDQKVMAIRPKAFEPASGGAGSVSSLEVDAAATVKLLEVVDRSGDSVDLEAAEVIVAVGQGLNSQSDLPMA
jgi:electron transfer flavoprotein alpha subunit